MLSRSLILVCAILFTVPLNNDAVAQSRPGDYLVALKSGCRPEIANRCKGVRNQSGRLLTCLYDHRTELSEKCEGIVNGSLARIGETLGGMNAVRLACDRDARQRCDNIVAGRGHLLGCLMVARRSLSATCKATVTRAYLQR